MTRQATRIRSAEARSIRNFRLILSVLCVGAIADNIYLAHEYTTQNFSSCNLNSYISCGTVALSGHTSLFGVPFWAMGLAYFPLIILVGWFLSKEILILLLLVGDIFTTYLWFLELAVIHAVCPLCVSLYGFNYVLTAIVAVYLFRSYK